MGAVDAAGRGVPHPGVRRAAPGPRRSSRPSSPTTSTWAARRTSRCCSSRDTAGPQAQKPQAGGIQDRDRPATADGVTINAFWRHSRVKQYLKDGRALRIETVVNSPDDLGCQRRLCNLPELQARARAVNARLLHTEKVGQGCVFDSPAFARISQPTLTGDGRRAPGLRFGDPRVMALAGALANMLCAVTGITNKSLRALMTGLLGTAYSMNQASYDLARLCPQRPDHPHPATATCYCPDPRRPAVRGSSTPRSTTASCARSWRATSPRRRPNSPRHWPPSTSSPSTTSPRLASLPQPDIPSRPATHRQAGLQPARQEPRNITRPSNSGLTSKTWYRRCPRTCPARCAAPPRAAGPGCARRSPARTPAPRAAAGARTAAGPAPRSAGWPRPGPRRSRRARET